MQEFSNHGNLHLLEKIASKVLITNAKFTGKPMPINPPPTGDHLYPTISAHPFLSLIANFGDDLAKPFKFDINKMI
jgi:hypothetical protein